jgi:hypothetical protein
MSRSGKPGSTPLTPAAKCTLRTEANDVAASRTSSAPAGNGPRVSGDPVQPAVSKSTSSRAKRGICPA